ncbi:Uncharacterised protein [uncultured Clostridium sp.]|nr:Uncharacterised protein [uncultured Clostridium sp.]
MSIVNTLALESNRQIKINFYGGVLSSDAGLLLIKEFISKLGIDTLLEKAFKTNDPAFKSVLEKAVLASQPTVSRFFNRMDKDTLNQFLAIARVLRRKIYSVQRCHRLLFWIWIPLFLMHTADSNRILFLCIHICPPFVSFN